MGIENFNNIQSQGEQMPEEIGSNDKPIPATRVAVSPEDRPLSEEYSREGRTEDKELAEKVAHYVEDGMEATRKLNNSDSKPATRVAVSVEDKPLSEEFDKDGRTEDKNLAEDVAHYVERGMEATRKLNNPSSIPATRVASPAQNSERVPEPKKPWWKKIL